MYIFKEPKQAVRHTVQLLLSSGQYTTVDDWQGTDKFKGEKMKVLINHNIAFRCPKTQQEVNNHFKPDLEWVKAHFKERISGIPSNPGESYKIWPYANFEKEQEFLEVNGGKFSHTYQERFWPPQNKGIRFKMGDLNDLIILLRRNPNTRQAYLPIFFPEDTGAKHNQRVPCTLGYHFFLWDGLLHVNYYIRSCDIYRHFRNDCYFTAQLLRHVARQTDNRVGNVYMYIANLHLFESTKYPFVKRETNIFKENFNTIIDRYNGI